MFEMTANSIINVLNREPYASFINEYNKLNGTIDEKLIELTIDFDECELIDGFWHDGCYHKEKMIKFWLKENSNGTNENDKSTEISACIMIEFDPKEHVEVHLERIESIKQRIPFFFIPMVSHMKTKLYLDDEYFNVNIEVIVPNTENIKDVCMSIINQYICMFSMID